MADTNPNNGSSLIPLDSTIAPPAPEVPTHFEVKRLGDPYLTMVQLVSNQWGPCPISGQFPMHGGTLTIHFSASVHTDANIPSGSIAQVGYQILVDNVVVGSATTFVSQADQWTLVSAVMIVENLSVDNHVVSIQPWGIYTSNDQFNLFNLTVIEQ